MDNDLLKNKHLYTFRGHEKPTTALAYCDQNGHQYLISGDQEGTVIIWDLVILRMVSKYQSLVESQIQSLKVLKLSSIILFAQSRNDGLKLFTLFEDQKPSLNQITHFRSHDLLFSRGDAIPIDDNLAALAYPSEMANHMVSVRIVNVKGETVISGNAQRYHIECEKTSSVFDIRILNIDQERFNLFVGYEDGCICIFEFTPSSTTTIPALNTIGLKLDLVKNYNLEARDFVAAFDVKLSCDTVINIVGGSPKDHLIFVRHAIASNAEDDLRANFKKVQLTNSGVSVIAIRPDNRVVAVARWGRNVDLYSMMTGKLLLRLNHHRKQVQSLLFIEHPPDTCGDNYVDWSTSPEDDTVEHLQKPCRYLLFCASMEGTISISSIY